MPFDAGAIDSVAGVVLEWYLAEGYPFASVAVYPSLGDTLVINTVPGRHASLESVLFPDSVRTSERILLRELRLACGEPYDRSLVESWLNELEKLPFIESAGPPYLAMGTGGNMVLTVPVEEAPPGWFYGDVDFDGDGGLTGGGEVVFNNLFGTGRRLRLSGEATDWGGLDAMGSYREPWIFGSPVSLELEASQEVPDSGSVIREWSTSVIFDLGQAEVSGGGGVWRSYPLGAPEESYSYGSAGLSWDLTRRVPQGRSGFSGTVITDAGSVSGPDSSYVLTRASGNAAYQWFRGALGLGAMLKGGGIISGTWPETMVTRLGGYGSIRGYAEDSWRAGTWGVLSPEVSLGETGTRLYGFMDMGALKTHGGTVEYPVSAGIGIRGVSGGLGFDAGAGFPLDLGLASARFFISARISL